MRVLHVIYSMETGGAQKLLSELLPIMKNTGIEVELLVYYLVNNQLEDAIRKAGIPIHSLNRAKIKDLNVVFELRKYLKSNDIIHTHLFPSLYQVALANIGLHKKLIYTEHSTHNRRRDISFIRHLERFIYNKYSAIVGISRRSSDNLINWLKQSSSKIITIPNGIILPKLSDTIFPKNEVGYEIMMVSRFTKAKDQQTLIRAIPHIKAKNFVVTFVGDGETIDECKELVKSLGVEKSCRFLGNRSDAQQLMSKAYIGVQSSNWEGFGLTAVEFMSYGKPIIASDVYGLREVVDDAGLLFPKENEIVLANYIDQLIIDPLLYKSISEKCINRAAKYNIKETSTRYVDLYKKLGDNYNIN